MRTYDELVSNLAERHAEEKATLEAMQSWLWKLPAVLQEVTGAELYFFGSGASIHMAGTKADLLTVLRAAKHAGLRIDSRDIAQTKAAFTLYPPDGNALNGRTLQIHFSSTQCKLVPKGTKTVEVTDYEVDCGGESLEDVA